MSTSLPFLTTRTVTVPVEFFDGLRRSAQQAHPAVLIDAVRDAGYAAGQALFKVHCAVCHRMGGEGNVVGPQLDGVGNRGVERLCEDILDPHRAVDPNFRMHVVTKKDGGVLAGLVRRDEKDGLTLVDAAGQETTVARDQVAKDETAVLSLMPATFGASLTEAEFHALVAWLATQKAEVRSEK
jgi:putative heme-binding domain-containing protein